MWDMGIDGQELMPVPSATVRVDGSPSQLQYPKDQW